MTYTYDERIVSDLHKDAYGFRPGEGQWYAVKAMSLDELELPYRVDARRGALVRAHAEVGDRQRHGEDEEGVAQGQRDRRPALLGRVRHDDEAPQIGRAHV